MIEAVPFDLAFEEAIAWFRSKGYAISADSWRDVWKEANARSFTVARVTEMDVLMDIRDEVDKAIATGETLDQFVKNLAPTLERKGWLAPQGEAAIVQLPDGSTMQRIAPWRLDTIYDTNLQTAYSVGRYEQQMEVAEQRPLWQYNAVIDEVTTPECEELNGVVYHYDHPFWDEWYPPNHFF